MPNHRDTRKTHRCSCGKYASLRCDWPNDNRHTGTCDKSICKDCARSRDGKDYCPFHRGEPPKPRAVAVLEGEAEARKVANMLGVER